MSSRSLLLSDKPDMHTSKARKDAYVKHADDCIDVTCFMLACMISELQTRFEDMDCYSIIEQLKSMFIPKARQERFNTVKDLLNCKLAKGSAVGPHVLKLKSYVE